MPNTLSRRVLRAEPLSTMTMREPRDAMISAPSAMLSLVYADLSNIPPRTFMAMTARRHLSLLVSPRESLTNIYISFRSRKCAYSALAEPHFDADHSRGSRSPRSREVMLRCNLILDTASGRNMRSGAANFSPQKRILNVVESALFRLRSATLQEHGLLERANHAWHQSCATFQNVP